MSTTLTRWAIQKNGRLTDKSIAVINTLHGTHISMLDFSEREYYEDKEKGLRIFLVRDDDIPFLVHEGYCDIGVCSQIIREEALCDDVYTHKLGYLLCRLVLATHKDTSGIDSVLVTKFPNLARKIYKEKYTIVKLHGGTELAHELNISSSILELTQSGDSLKKYGYDITEVINEYDTEIIVHKKHEDLYNRVVSTFTL
jgi:ATP phosphoribosyltransferase